MKPHSASLRPYVYLAFLSPLAASCTLGCAQGLGPDSTVAVTEVADAVIRGTSFQFVDGKTGERFETPEAAGSNATLRLASPYTDWRYWNGVINIAMGNLGEALGNRLYSEYPRKNVAFAFDHSAYFESRYNGEDKWSYPFGQLFVMEELDDYGAMGASVIEVNRLNPQERYRAYIDRAAGYVESRQHRLDDGTFVRSFPRMWTLWADDLYMSLSLLTRLGEVSGDARYFDDAALQVRNFHKYLFNEQAGLMSHCWYSDQSRAGAAYWGRANGWVLLAQVDLLDRLPLNHPQRKSLLTLFQRHVLGVARRQSGGGLWHQLLDKPDSFLETSCSAMFTYVVARGVNRKYLDPSFAAIAWRGWKGVISKIHADGSIEGVCTGTVVSEDLNYYYQRPTPPNDVHGVGAVLLAGAEMLQLQKQSN